MIGIVTVNWRGYDATHNLVTNLLKSNYLDYRLVIVNNSPEELNLFENNPLFDDPRVVIIQSKWNQGYSGGLNAGIKRLLPDTKITHFLLLNNDVEFDIDFIQSFFFKAKDKHKIYAPLILLDGTEFVQNTGGNLHLWLGGSTNLNKNTPIHKVRRVKPDFLSGCILYMHRSVIETVGLFNETYGSYYEDVDYCYRAKNIGFSLEILWDIQARHFHSFSTKDNLDYKVYLLSRNQIIFAKKHLAPAPRIVFILAAIGRGFLQNLFQKHLQAYIRGMKEGFRC